MEINSIKIEKNPDEQLIIGHAGFIKTAEDLYEAMVNSVPNIKFGIAFVEASGPCLVRSEGNDKELIEKAQRNALSIGAGHTFLILFKNAYPINVVNAIKAVPEVVGLYCATANEVEVFVANGTKGKAIIGIADGESAKGLEGEEEKSKRRKFVRDIGYKLG
jgi:Uncharacterized conserved protein